MLDIDIYEILNALSELVYIVDMDTHELLYMNESGREKFNVTEDEIPGKKCYEVLQHQEKPCEFCTNRLLQPDRYYVWERYNRVLGAHFKLRDKLINYNGKLVRFEIATDITSLKEQNQDMSNLLSMDDLLIRCTAKLHEKLSLPVRIDAIFKVIGEALGADRVYLFERDDNVFCNTHEWCNEGVSPQLNNLQNIEDQVMRRWILLFEKNECVIITDVEEIKTAAPEEYMVLKKQDISTLVAAPLNLDGKLIGFIGVDNPTADKLKYSPAFFTAISYFFASILSREETENRLRLMSYRDSLTGLNNRNRFSDDIKSYNENQTEKMGVAFIDLNGLKAINDSCGHLSGDRKLIRLAQILRYVFEDRNIYRIGGDEFCVLCAPVEEKDFNRRIAKLREFFANPDDCHAAMGYGYSSGYRNVNDIIKDADRMMYESKQGYYKQQAVESAGSSCAAKAAPLKDGGHERAETQERL